MESFIEDKTVYIPKNRNENGIMWKSICRQILIVSNAWSLYFCLGLQFGTITVLVPQLRHSNITVTDEMVSWMSSAVAYAAIPWIIIISSLAHIIGWKKTAIFTSLATITGNIIFCLSNTPTVLLISEAFFGITQGATASIYVVLIAEYTSPQYRGLFLCIKSANYFWGIWLANAIGAFTYWRYIPFVGLCSSFLTLTVFFWPESPSWLATKKRFAECREAHRWLKGYDKKAEEELKRLIESQNEVVGNDRVALKNLKFVMEREFYFPLIVCMIALLSYHATGKFVITAYAVDVIKKMIKDESTVHYTMIIIDGTTVFFGYVGCFISKMYERRVIWLVSYCIIITFLLTLSLYIYLVKLCLCSENIYLTIFLLSGFSISVAFGPMILALAWSGELIPYRYKSVSIIIVSVWFIGLHGIFLKVSPIIIKTLDLHGTFLFYGISSGVCTSIMYFYLPETKDKTLVDIERYFKEKNKGSIEEADKLVL